MPLFSKNYKVMSKLEIIAIAKDYLRYLEPKKHVKNPLVRIGSANDGGYILVDDITKTDVLISAGIALDLNFENVFSARADKVLMYDHSVTEPNLLPNQFFYQIAMVAHKSRNLPFTQITLNEVLSENPAEDYILKLDIEGSEWEVLDHAQTSDLLKFRQIVIEYHYLTDFNSHYAFEIQMRVLEKLQESHTLIYAHWNNWSDRYLIGPIDFGDCLEVTYVRKDSYNLIEGVKREPLLEAPNNLERDGMPGSRANRSKN